jgi:hypothetical protein
LIEKIDKPVQTIGLGTIFMLLKAVIFHSWRSLNVGCFSSESEVFLFLFIDERELIF